MSKYTDCIEIALKQGKIDKRLANALKGQDMFEASPDEAVSHLLDGMKTAKREVAINAIRVAQAWDLMQTHKHGLAQGLISLLGRDKTGASGYANVDMRSTFYRTKYQKRMADMIARFHTKGLGLTQDKKGLTEFVEGMYGKQSKDPEIMKMVDDFNDMVEEIRQTFNSVGGSIQKNDFWKLPQIHDPVITSKMPFEEWFALHKEWVDIPLMEVKSGRKFANAADFEKAMKESYDAIRTDGLSKAEPLAQPRGGVKISRRGAEQRFIYYKDAASWMAANERLGKGDIFATLTEWVDQKAHEISLMSILGTNPESTFKILMNEIKRSPEQMGQAQEAFLNAEFNVISGKTSMGSLTGLADGMQSVSNVMTAGQLGSAAISGLSDVGFTAVTSVYNDIPTVKVMSRYFKTLNPKNLKDKKAAWGVQMAADAFTNRLSQTNRFGDESGIGKTGKLAEVVIRASGLAAMTDAMRIAFGVEFSIKLANEFHLPFNKLSARRLRGFKSYGIDEKTWNTFRKASNHLDFEQGKIANFEAEGGEPFHQMIMTETDFAVPMPDAVTRAITTGGLGRNTVAGQAVRGVFKYKSFVVAVASTHLNRAIYQPSTMQGLGYLGSIVAATTVMGGVALQAKDIVMGRTPRPVDEHFIPAAIMQGGGLGIMGDLVFSDVNRFGGSIAKTIIGPWGDLADRIIQLGIGSLQEGLQGKDLHFTKELSDDINTYMPKVWYTKRIQQTFINSMTSLVDPSNRRRLAQRDRKRERDYNQETWWSSNKNVLEQVN